MPHRWHFLFGNTSRGLLHPPLTLPVIILHSQVCTVLEVCQEHILVAAKECLLGEEYSNRQCSQEKWTAPGGSQLLVSKVSSRGEMPIRDFGGMGHEDEMPPEWGGLGVGG